MTIEKLGRLLPSHSTNYLRFLSKAIMPTRATLIEPSAPTMDKFADVGAIFEVETILDGFEAK